MPVYWGLEEAVQFCHSAYYVRVMESVDVDASKASAARRVGSNPTLGTIVVSTTKNIAENKERRVSI